jgi:uncharacterized protein YdaU (DUF1376 family)
MSAKNWMPIYWGDYLRDTAHLTAAQHGAYLLLIGHYWQTGGPLIDKDDHLRRAARMDKGEWRKNRDVILAFFKTENGFVIHPRIDQEILLWGAKREKATLKAERAAAARWADRDEAEGDAPSITASTAQALLDQCPPPPPVLSDDKTYPVAGATAAEQPTLDLGDKPLKATAFSAGLASLARATGKNPDTHRSMVGKWVKQYGEAAVLAALIACEREVPVEPIAWIIKSLEFAKNGPGNRNGRRVDTTRSAFDLDDLGGTEVAGSLDGRRTGPVIDHEP